MKYAKMVAWGAVAALLFMISSPGFAQDEQKGKRNRQGVESPSQELAGAAHQPVYVPPLRSAPGGRVGGSTRGARFMPMLSALVPDHTGLTVHEQPSLFWYLAGETTYPVELTITENGAQQPLIESRLSGTLQAGVQRIRLADYGVHLALDVPYQWSVALVVDPDSRARANIAGGTIERIALPKALQAKLRRAGKTKAPAVYAEAGLWYDALTAISDLIDAAPNDPALRQQWSGLLEQVGLRQIAEHDMRRSATR